MHKRNVTLIAALWAVLVMVAITWLPIIHRSDWLGIAYFPAILLSVVLSGHTHSPGPVPVWSASIAYTLLYLLVFVITYAIILEIYLLRSSVSRMIKSGVFDADPQRVDPRAAFESVGRTVHELETRRRRHWVLDARPEVNLSEAHLSRGQRVFAGESRGKTEAALMRALNTRLRKKWGDAGAKAVIRRLGDSAGPSSQPPGDAPKE